MVSPEGSARAASGHSRIPIANDRNPGKARTRIRRELTDILYPGALTSRLKRYAAEPAPDSANLTSMCEPSANGAEKACLPAAAPAERNPVQAADWTNFFRTAPHSSTLPLRLK